MRILHLFNLANILYHIYVTCDFQHIEILYKVSCVRIVFGDHFYHSEWDKVIVGDNETTNYSSRKDRRQGTRNILRGISKYFSNVFRKSKVSSPKKRRHSEYNLLSKIDLNVDNVLDEVGVSIPQPEHDLGTNDIEINIDGNLLITLREQLLIAEDIVSNSKYELQTSKYCSIDTWEILQTTIRNSLTTNVRIKAEISLVKRIIATESSEVFNRILLNKYNLMSSELIDFLTNEQLLLEQAIQSMSSQLKECISYKLEDKRRTYIYKNNPNLPSTTCSEDDFWDSKSKYMYSQVEYALNLGAINNLRSLLKYNECNTQEKEINHCTICREVLSILVEYSRDRLSRRPAGYFHNKTFGLLYDQPDQPDQTEQTDQKYKDIASSELSELDKINPEIVEKGILFYDESRFKKDELLDEKRSRIMTKIQKLDELIEKIDSKELYFCDKSCKRKDNCFFCRRRRSINKRRAKYKIFTLKDELCKLDI
ncbi:uncharacterized protein CMU_004440 [Cryptosporidium muris RN66]|uniref:Uncharacterized protein n=1 Tax=Cryptosporidium muris (strain RN66) TaxID=441375 RepID=B6AK54_CRYMR|nr:uncharacterized protein CMU_004440 [Cryptosporidium muris RN66]EEA08595.1 hypothetical protein CMU_004440 [Cryptosporidium muris RN66]|eukprot:XP_002142944.1 hypothetical protein [Cryptosporidium muris RN66]